MLEPIAVEAARIIFCIGLYWSIREFLLWLGGEKVD